MAEPAERLTYSISEAAVILGIGKGLCYELARRGELPGLVKLGRKRYVVSRTALTRLLSGDSDGRDG